MGILDAGLLILRTGFENSDQIRIRPGIKKTVADPTKIPTPTRQHWLAGKSLFAIGNKSESLTLAGLDWIQILNIYNYFENMLLMVKQKQLLCTNNRIVRTILTEL